MAFLHFALPRDCWIEESDASTILIKTVVCLSFNFVPCCSLRRAISLWSAFGEFCSRSVGNQGILTCISITNKLEISSISIILQLWNAPTFDIYKTRLLCNVKALGLGCGDVSPQVPLFFCFSGMRSDEDRSKPILILFRACTCVADTITAFLSLG